MPCTRASAHDSARSFGALNTVGKGSRRDKDLTMTTDHGACLLMDSVAISESKARCLAILEKVRRTGRPIVITRHGEPVAEVVPPSPAHREENWLGCASGSGHIVGDLIAPASDEREWEVLSE